MHALFQKLSKQFPVTSFLALTFLWTWLWWTPLAISLKGEMTTNIPLTLSLVLIGAFGPTLSAILVTWAQEGVSGINTLLKQVVYWRIPWQWYLVLLVLPPFLWFITLLSARFFLSMNIQLTAPWLLFPFALLSSLLGGPIAEETGWRGYLVPYLQKRTTALLTGICVGIIWAIWHFPAFYVQGIALAIAETGQPLAMLRYLLTAIPVGVLFVWLFNNTRGSLLISILFHASLNASAGFAFAAQVPPLPAYQIQTLTWIYVVVVWLVTAAVVWYWKPDHLSKSKPTYEINSTA
jgi:membrane protease YdiL (CAAX protease family)